MSRQVQIRHSIMDAQLLYYLNIIQCLNIRYNGNGKAVCHSVSIRSAVIHVLCALEHFCCRYKLSSSLLLPVCDKRQEPSVCVCIVQFNLNGTSAFKAVYDPRLHWVTWQPSPEQAVYLRRVKNRCCPVIT